MDGSSFFDLGGGRSSIEGEGRYPVVGDEGETPLSSISMPSR